MGDDKLVAKERDGYEVDVNEYARAMIRFS